MAESFTPSKKLEEDAIRYRWLRAQGYLDIFVRHAFSTTLYQAANPAAIDKAIDIEMAE